MRRYLTEEILGALRTAAVELGHPPSMNAWRRERRSPSTTAIIKRFGTWNGAIAAAGLEVSPQGDAEAFKFDETAEVIERLDAGETLADIGRGLGVSGQALGRRVRRYRTLSGMDPVTLPRGRRAGKTVT